MRTLSCIYLRAYSRMEASLRMLISARVRSIVAHKHFGCMPIALAGVDAWLTHISGLFT